MQKIVSIVIVIIIFGFGLWFFGDKTRNDTSSLDEDSVVSEEEPFVNGNEIMIDEKEDSSGSAFIENEKAVVLVNYTNSQFEPKEITVPLGTTVTFQNESDGGMWVASAIHPTHNIYPEFDELKSIKKGESYTFVFDKVGTWKYHNHVNSSKTGTVIVEE